MDRSTQPCASPNCTFNELFIDCSGCCRQQFHAVCVGLSADAVSVITSSPNWFWFCDVCRDLTWLERITGLVKRTGSAEEEKPPGGEKSCGSSNCIFIDQLVTCDGPCGKDFHGMCVKLSETDLAVIGSSLNILWVCDGCKGKVPPVRDDSEELEDEHVAEDDSMVVKLETKFESIIAKLNRLNENLENGVYTPPDSSPNSEENSDAEGSRAPDDQVAEPADDTVTQATEAVNNDIVTVPAFGDLTRSKYLDSSTLNDKVPVADSPKRDPVKIFTFGSAKRCETPEAKPNFSFSIPTDCVELFKKTLAEQRPKSPKLVPVKQAELEKDDNNNNVTNPEKPPQEIVSKKVELIPPAKQDDSKFALWIKFDDPDLSSREVCSMVRKVLGMAATDSVEARNVVPGHIRFTSQALFASFKVDLDARWKKKALDGATWRSVVDYRAHSEWVNRW